MSGKVCKDGCFWTPVTSGNFAKGVCWSLSQRQHGVLCQVKTCGCHCSSQLWKILFSNFQTLKKIQNVMVCSSIRQLNIMRNSGGLKTVLSKDTWKDWGLKQPSKQCRSGFAEIQSGNRRSYPESWTYQSNQWCTSSGAINTWQCTQRDTSSLLLWRRSNG